MEAEIHLIVTIRSATCLLLYSDGCGVANVLDVLPVLVLCIPQFETRICLAFDNFLLGWGVLNGMSMVIIVNARVAGEFV
jgi:hypothetical protein